MVRGAGWDEMLFATVWRCGVSWLWVVAFDFRRLCTGVTHPLPLSRGEVWNAVFLLVVRGLMACRIPLLRGDQGVCYDEGRGMGGDVFAAVW